MNHEWETVGENTGPGYIVWCSKCGTLAQDVSRYPDPAYTTIEDEQVPDIELARQKCVS